jgi:hypothetical protein
MPWVQQLTKLGSVGVLKHCVGAVLIPADSTHCVYNVVLPHASLAYAPAAEVFDATVAT